MKQLVALTTILIVVGIGGFMYRNALERPISVGEGAGTCTQEARLCPDGSSVGRTGHDCAFATCALPNVEDATTGIAFVIPAGYTATANGAGADETLRAALEKPFGESEGHSILIRRYAVHEGETTESVMLANTLLEPKGEGPESVSAYTPVTIGGKNFHRMELERFEGVVRTAYFLARTSDVVRFEVVERGVDWTNPKLDTSSFPEHKALLTLLTTLQVK
jgi:hypothetical protein